MTFCSLFINHKGEIWLDIFKVDLLMYNWLYTTQPRRQPLSKRNLPSCDGEMCKMFSGTTNIKLATQPKNRIWQMAGWLFGHLKTRQIVKPMLVRGSIIYPPPVFDCIFVLQHLLTTVVHISRADFHPVYSCNNLGRIDLLYCLGRLTDTIN